MSHVKTNLKLLDTHCVHESASNDIFGMFQFNADCSDDIPPDYEASVGGPANPISGASEITVNESSVVLDPAGRAIGLQQLHPNVETEPEAADESHIIASSKYRYYTFTQHRINELAPLSAFVMCLKIVMGSKFCIFVPHYPEETASLTLLWFHSCLVGVALRFE